LFTALSNEIHALAHHVNLYEAGWRDRALELITIKVLGDGDGLHSPEALTNKVNEMLPVPIGNSHINQILDKLIKDGKVVEVSTSSIKLSEETRTKLREQLENQYQLEKGVQDTFDTIFEDLDQQADIHWNEFRDEFLFPLVSELGVRAYELLSGESIDVGRADAYVRFIDRVPKNCRSVFSDQIALFLNAQNHEVRSYILRLLNTVFLVQATHLSDKTLEYVIARTKQSLRINVIVDTNFLFSLIGLHDNPADDVSGTLQSLIGELNDKLDVRLFILPITVDEAKRTIAAYESKLSGLYLSRDMSLALKNNTQDLSGITLKFIEQALKAKKRLSSSDYFKPFNDNLLQIARSKGIELYNESTDELSKDQLVIDDIHLQMEYEKKRKPQHRQKSYETLLHDIILWHFTRGKRPERLESPLDARFWVATIDFSLLGFDRFKSRKFSGEPPVCIHPTVLLQILQLWIPRNEMLEKALIASLQPLLPHEFDTKAEEVTIRILQTLSQIESSDAIGHETIARILIDNAVRSRINTVASNEEKIEVVRSALARENRRLELKSRQLEREASGLKTEVREGKSEIHKLQEEIQDYSYKQQSLQDELDQQKGIIDQINERTLQEQKAKARRLILLWTIFSGLFLTSTIWYLLTELNVTPIKANTVSVLVFIGGCLAGLSISTYFKHVHFKSAKWPKWIYKVTKWYWGVVILSIVIGGFVDWVFIKPTGSGAH